MNTLQTQAPLARWAMRRYTRPRIDHRLEDRFALASRRKATWRTSQLDSASTRDANGDGGPGDGSADGSDGGDDRRTGPDDRRARVLVILALVVGLLGIGGSWMWIATLDARALRGLPAPQRAHVLQRALTNLADVCDPFPPRSLATFCSEQAEIAASFDECDSACLALARRHLNPPVR